MVNRNGTKSSLLMPFLHIARTDVPPRGRGGATRGQDQREDREAGAETHRSDPAADRGERGSRPGGRVPRFVSGGYGTILGAAVGSVLATTGGATFQHLFRPTGDQLRDSVVLTRPQELQRRCAPERGAPLAAHRDAS